MNGHKYEKCCFCESLQEKVDELKGTLERIDELVKQHLPPADTMGGISRSRLAADVWLILHPYGCNGCLCKTLIVTSVSGITTGATIDPLECKIHPPTAWQSVPGSRQSHDLEDKS